MKPYYRQKDGGWQVIISYKSGGEWTTKSKQGFKAKKEAQKWAEKAMLTILEDKADNVTASDMTLGELCRLVVDLKKKQARPGTAKVYENTVNSLREDFLSKKVCDITPFDVTNYFLALREETGRSYTNHMMKLKTIFNVAVEDLKIIRTNPVKVLKNNRKDERTLYITKELFTEMIAGASERQRLIINILYYTGMRYSEVMGITVKNIGQNTLKVDLQVDRHTNKFCPLKTENSEREIPIPEWLAREMKTVKKVGIDGRIFPTYTDIKKYLKSYNVTAHCFRHTYATNLVHKGINLKVAADILGDTFETFCKTYVESSKDLAKEEYKKIIASF